MAEGKVARNTAYILSATVGQKLIALAYFMVVAHLAGVGGTGQYVVATTFALIAASFVDFGLSNVIVREVARKPEEAGSYLGAVLTIKVVLMVVVGLASQAVAAALGYAPEVRAMIAVAVVAVLVESLGTSFYGVLRGFQNLRFEAIGVISGQAALLVVGVTLYYLWRHPVMLVIGLLVNTSWNMLWAWWAAATRLKIKPRLSFDGPVLRQILYTALPFATATVFSRVYTYVDSLLLSKFGSTADVGLYASANKLTFAFLFLPAAVAAALYPAMSEYFVKDKARLAMVFETSFKYLLIIAAPIAFGVAALADQLVALVYPPEFQPAAGALRVLIWALPFAFIYWPTGSLLNAAGRQTRNTAVMGTTMVINIVLNIALMPTFGAAGAAAAALVTNALLVSMALLAARGAAPVRYGRVAKAAGLTLLAAAVMGLVVYLLKDSAPLWFSVPIGAMAYGAAALALRVVTVNEVRGAIWLFCRSQGRKEAKAI